jgi:hypothetical protein
MRLAYGLSASAIFYMLTAMVPAWSAGAAGVLVGAHQDRLAYKVVKGDNLESIAEKVTGNAAHWQEIAKANRLHKAQALRAGQQLNIPRNLVPDRSTVAQVLSAKGPIAIQEGTSAAAGNLGEGSRVETAQGASVLLQLQDGTRILIEPGSKVILEKMRQYYASDAVEARIKLESGRIEVNSPRERRFPFEVNTQRGTAAVRGTEFRVAANGAANTSEVLRGSIAYSAARTSLALPAGDGVSLPADSDKPVIERLAPAPTLLISPRYEDTSAVLSWDALGQASYRAIITRDAQGLDVLSNQLVPQAQLTFDSPSDGQFFLHVRGVSPTGIEGFSSSKAFEVQARPIAPEFRHIDSADRTTLLATVKLVWTQKENLGTLVQLAGDENFSQLLHEATTTAASMEIPRELFGRKLFFRLASLETRAGVARRGPFAAGREILW